MCGWSVPITRCWWSEAPISCCYTRNRYNLPITKFLFGNINRKPIADVVSELATVHRSNIVILAESVSPPTDLLASLNSGPGGGFHLSTGVSKGIRILTRFSREFLGAVFESDHRSVSRLEVPAR